MKIVQWNYNVARSNITVTSVQTLRPVNIVTRYTFANGRQR